MLSLALPSRIFVCTLPTDMRKSFDTLAALVQTHLGQDALSGDLFVFRSRRGNRLKLLWWDGSGLCLFAKRLEKGRFVWPRVENGAITLTPAQLAMLIEGLDWRRAVAFKDLPTPTAV